MRALTITADHRLQLVEAREPIPAPGEVLIDVELIGVNRADIAQTAGAYPAPPFLTLLLADSTPSRSWADALSPDIGTALNVPGLEVVGTRRDTGERVAALIAGNGYAETVAAPLDSILPLPDPDRVQPSRSPDSDTAGPGVREASANPALIAASTLEAAATVVSNLHLETQIQPGERVLIHGATGSVGLTAVQFAKARGAYVTAVAGSAERSEFLRDLGADAELNRRTRDVFEQLAESWSAEDSAQRGSAQRDPATGFDVILDVLGGGDALAHNIDTLNDYGRLVV